MEDNHEPRNRAERRAAFKKLPKEKRHEFLKATGKNRIVHKSPSAKKPRYET